ncbi:histamine H2 receptor-like [Exaiptasia diaphana]|uniref:G-protein coupled receptors family 1 profile domain-containing protein n=1 Tax=Exaiptasia diaphana TaxID=2652724 RepID=A0A913XL98_EXADI|nr:histamine H2 receptor-like [Exaiptasia diaphana]
MQFINAEKSEEGTYASMNCSKVKSFLQFSRENDLTHITLLVALVAGTFTWFLIVCSNLLVIYTIAKTPTLQTPSNCTILGLSIADLTVGLLVQPIHLTSIFVTHENDFEHICCISILYGFFGWFIFPISAMHLTLLTMDRFLAIRLHLRYQELITSKRYVCASIVIWIYGFTIGTIYTFKNELLGYILIAFYFSNAIAIYSVSITFWNIRKHSSQIQVQHQNVEETLSIQRLKKSINTMYIIIVALIVSHLPYIFYFVKRQASLDVLENRNGFLIYIITEHILVLNSFVNPIIYFWRIEELRKGAWRVIRVSLGKQ